MKQIAQNYKTGELTLLDVPAPACRPGGVLVKSDFSLVSAGTEMMKIEESKLSLLGKARARPDQVKKVMQTVAQQGVLATWRKVMDKLDSYTPLGYSVAGTVVEVGAGAEPLTVGQRVACAGNIYALHAEYNWVPRNLVVPIPDGVPSDQAAFTTVAAIALQGLRQSEAKLGEVALVIGLGLVGQLLLQFLRAAGVHVVGVDLSQERCDQAVRLGAVAAAAPGSPGMAAMEAAANRISRGHGMDHVFITAGGSSNAPAELAVKMARDRARIVDIGKSKLDLPWNSYYEKELELRFSRSYGPGRYDPFYEEGGIDYPIGYVRWTEGRNMECVLDLLAAKQVDFAPLIATVAPFADAVSTYEKVNKGELSGLGVLFKYSGTTPLERRMSTPAAARAGTPGKVRLGVIGSGNYANSMLLPHLAANADVELVEVATATGLSAANAQRKFRFQRQSTDYRGMLADAGIDAVLIATRHNAHAGMVCEALEAGKAVFVEKPLAVDASQLARVMQTVQRTGNARLQVGFNRRFAPMLVQLKQDWGARRGPVAIRYQVNAGPLPANSWYLNAEEGSRFVGEGCHFVDTVSWWLGLEPVSVFAAGAGDDADNLGVTLLYADGSRAEIAYLTEGDPAYPKEIMEVYGEGTVARLHNFQRTELWRNGKATTRKSMSIDKGQKAELDAFIAALKAGGAMPIPPDSLFATTAATFAAERAAVGRTLSPVTFADPAD